MDNNAKCDRCGKSFKYKLIHNGFNDSSYSYCDRCGTLSMLDQWKVPEGITLKPWEIISSDIEPLLAPCQCGGRFRANVSPRCPHCNSPLSADKAARWLEANAPGTKTGWRWQRNWVGLYAISIEGRYVIDNWRHDLNSPRGDDKG